ncbi:hypothetical protein [Tateyamaria omphalii]|nr:hypothetical protein [Tateyamaria omphalii]
MPLTLSAAKSMILALAIALGCVASGAAQPLLRIHTPTEAEQAGAGALRTIPPATEGRM